jgi:hypothetical protein
MQLRTPAAPRSLANSLGDRRGLVGGHRDIFCVEAALWILPVVGIDFIADSQPPHPRADRRDDARTVEAENHRKVRFAGGKISLPDVGVPSANACGIDRDQLRYSFQSNGSTCPWESSAIKSYPWRDEPPGNSLERQDSTGCD